MFVTIDIDVADADADGIAADLVVTGSDTDGIADDLAVGTAWDTEDAEWVTDEVDSGRARNIRVTTAGDEPGGNAPTLTLVGTDADGVAISEQVVLPNATFVDTVLRFLTVTSATASAATIDTMDIGWVIRDWNSVDDAEWVASAPTDGLAHQLVVTTAADETTLSNTMTLTGTDADGKAIEETVTLPATTTVETTKYFKTVTSAVTSSVGAGVFDIGWVDEVASRTYLLNRRPDAQALFQLDVTGTLSVDVQFTVANPAQFANQELVPWSAFVSGLDDETADVITPVTAGYAGLFAFRVILNSYSSGAEVQVYMSQPDNDHASVSP